MNKKSLFLALAVLLCANQASAGWMDSIKSGLNDAAVWVVSWMPESWQGRTCVALGVCTLAAAGYFASRGNSISVADAKRRIDERVAVLASDETLGSLTEEVKDGCDVSDHREFVKAYKVWDNDQLVAAYKYLKEHFNKTYRSRANEILRFWVTKALGKQVATKTN